MSQSPRNMEGKTCAELEVRHPYRLLNDDSVVRYEYLLRLQRQSCTGQRVFAICLIACTLLIIIFFFIFFTGETGSTNSSTPNLNPSGEISVRLSCGKILGKQDGDAFAFKGIPYALPPTGRRRWKPPQILLPHKGCWNGTLKCYHFGHKCLQMDPLVDTVEGNEDCLFVNVWTPTLDTQSRLPVVAFFHGGFLKWGSGHEPTLSPGGMISHQYNVVFVSFNYRLSAFGFLSLDILSANSTTNSSGNYGLQDQILLLQWIKENIAKFGGNPNKVTLFGQGSGATSILALMGSEKVKGLFHKAWLSSPAPIITSTLAEANEQHVHSFLNATGCSNLDCLLQLEPEKVLQDLPKDWGIEGQWELPVKGKFATPLIIVDGNILTESPENLWKNGSIGIDVPLLIGSTAQEAEPFSLGNEKTFWTRDDYETHVSHELNSFNETITKKALQIYNSTSALNGLEINSQLSFSTMVSDVRTICLMNSMAKLAAGNSLVYRYIVTAKLSKPIKLPFTSTYSQYSFNSIDVIAFFNQVDKYVKKPTRSDLQFQLEIQTAAMDFIRCGSMQLSSWKPYPKTIALISNQTTFSSTYHKEQCKLWNRDDFYKYGWIN